LSLAVVRDLREVRPAAGPDELAALETDVFAGFVLARAAAGLADEVPPLCGRCGLAGQGGLTGFQVRLIGRRLVGVVLLLVFEGAEVAQALLDAAGVVVKVGPGRRAGVSTGGFPEPLPAPDVRLSTHPALHRP
jgi:hypothetical protein